MIDLLLPLAHHLEQQEALLPLPLLLFILQVCLNQVELEALVLLLELLAQFQSQVLVPPPKLGLKEPYQLANKRNLSSYIHNYVIKVNLPIEDLIRIDD